MLNKLKIILLFLAIALPYNVNAKSFVKLAIGDTEIEQSNIFNSQIFNQTLQAQLSPVLNDISFNSTSFELAFGKKFTHRTGFYLSPIVSFEYINASNRDRFNINHKYNDRFSTYVNLGYEMNKISFYGLFGVANTSFEVDGSQTNRSLFSAMNQAVIVNGNRDTGFVKGRETSSIIGLGASYMIYDNISFGLEYTKQKLNYSTSHYHVLQGVITNNSKSSIESIQLNIINYF